MLSQFRKPTPDKLFLGYCTILLFLKYNIFIGRILHQDISHIKKDMMIESKIIHQFQNEDGTFGEGSQTGFAFAIALKLASPELLCQKFVQKIESDRGFLIQGFWNGFDI